MHVNKRNKNKTEVIATYCERNARILSLKGL
jgi:hypothetical protein